MKTTKKKSFKRLFAFLMAFVMVTALAANAVFAAGSFTDVSEGDDFYENIESLYEQGIIGGFADGTFRPGDYLTRQQAAKMIALGANYGDHDGTGSKLVDVADLTWGQENIWALEAAGVVKGFGTSKEFRPRLNITRGHVAKMIALAFGLEEGDVEVDLIDLPSDEEVADAIRILASNGIVSGFGKSKEFRPDALVTRGQFAKMVDLAMEAVQLKVVSVRAINGVTIEVRFNKPVDKDSAEAMGRRGKVEIDGVNLGERELSEDGKTLTISAWMRTRHGYGPINVTNAPVEVKPVLSKDKTVSSLRYVGLLTYKDTVRPTVEDVTYSRTLDTENEVVDVAKIAFSEPMDTFGTVLFNGEAAALYSSDYFEINISALDFDEEATITILGARDFAGNFLNPNPTTVTVVRPSKDETAPTVVSMDVISDTKVEVVFSEELSAVIFKVNGVEVSAEAEDDGVTYFLVKALNEGINTVAVTGFKDTSGNDGEDVTRTFIVALDKVAPTLVDSKVLVNDDGDEYLELTFSKEIELGAPLQSTFTGTHDLVVNQSFTANPEVDPDDATIVAIPLQGVAEGAWKITLDEGFVNDLTASENKLEAVEVTFVRGKDVTPEDEDEPQDVTLKRVRVTNNVVTLTFNGKLDGASAVNKANYAVEGAVVKAATLTANPDAGNAIVELTFEAGSIKITGNYQLVVSGVKAADGTAVTATPRAIYLTENIEPTILSAEITANDSIKVTFSKAVIVDADKVEVYVGDVLEPSTHGALTAANTVLNIEITEPFDAADLAKVIRVKVLADTVKDASGNYIAADTYATATLP